MDKIRYLPKEDIPAKMNWNFRQVTKVSLDSGMKLTGAHRSSFAASAQSRYVSACHDSMVTVQVVELLKRERIGTKRNSLTGPDTGRTDA